jgi:hypothetical protein
LVAKEKQNKLLIKKFQNLAWQLCTLKNHKIFALPKLWEKGIFEENFYFLFAKKMIFLMKLLGTNQ